MRKIKNRSLLPACMAAVIFSFSCLQVFAQVAFNMNSLRERLFISTDRDIYIAGEEAWLKVFKVNAETGRPDDMSKVIYLELLDRNNFPVSQLKIRADSCSGSSLLLIPANVATGNYILRAYTLFMQNWDPGLYAYKEVSVINPFEAPGNRRDSLQQPVLKRGNQIPVTDNGIKCVISTDRNAYGEREKANVQVRVRDDKGNPLHADLSVSVVRASLLRIQEGEKAANLTSIAQGPPEFLPEIEGHLISGTVRLRSTGDVLRNADVSLAKVGKMAGCRFTRTDDKGNFNFVADETGTQEIVIQPLYGRDVEYFVDLRQPFSSKFSDLRAGSFTPDSSILAEINKAIVAAQVKNIYEPFLQKSNNAVIRQFPDFYGRPENRIIMSDYIELTSLKEAVKEIIPDLSVSRHDDTYDFRLINKYRGVTFENSPLTLVDGVPVYDINKVLDISSREIERVDIINTRYFFSRNVFDGIVSIVTKKGNMSAMEFDNTVFRQVYDFCSEPLEFHSPDYSSAALKRSRLPDFRNTLYRNCAAGTGSDGRSDFSFFTGDEKGNFTIVVEGISDDGTRFRAVSDLQVR